MNTGNTHTKSRYNTFTYNTPWNNKEDWNPEVKQGEFGEELQKTEKVASVDYEKLAPNNPPFFKDKAQMENFQSINGIAIEELNGRARPGRYSYSGFIGAEENIKEVMRKDWETVEKLGVTHVEIAAHLTNIISLAEKVKSYGIQLATLEYRTSDLAGNTIPSTGFQKIKVMLMNTRGLQDDLFQPTNDGQREVATPKNWNEENSIQSEDYEENKEDVEKSKGVELYLNSGILSYIHHFGFYEGGGAKNRYRVDPVKVMSLLTGKSVEELKRTHNL